MYCILTRDRRMHRRGRLVGRPRLFSFTCDAPSVKKSKFCARDRQRTDAMRKQVTTEGRLDVFNRVIDNQAKATEAVEEYRRSATTDGLYSRRPLIDWGADDPNP